MFVSDCECTRAIVKECACESESLTMADFSPYHKTI